MRPLLLAAIAALVTTAGQADEVRFASRPVDIPVGSRLAMGLTNSCDAAAAYRLRVRSGDGTLVLSRDGELAPRGDVAFAYTPKGADAGVVVAVRLDCRGGTPKPWLSYIVQKAGGTVTRPRLGPLRGPLGVAGEVLEGTGI